MGSMQPWVLGAWIARTHRDLQFRLRLVPSRLIWRHQDEANKQQKEVIVDYCCTSHGVDSL